MEVASHAVQIFGIVQFELWTHTNYGLMQFELGLVEMTLLQSMSPQIGYWKKSLAPILTTHL
jgi:hypothetical protein